MFISLTYSALTFLACELAVCHPSEQLGLKG